MSQQIREEESQLIHSEDAEIGIHTDRRSHPERASHPERGSLPEGGSHSDIISFDQVLSDVGMGKSQIFLFLSIGLIGMTEGSQVSIFTLTIPILKHQWHVETYLNTLQASLVFLGILLGSMISGQIADRWGRRYPYLISAFLSLVCIILTAIAQNIYQMIILRLLLGLIVGFFGPLAITVLTEVTPQNQRGRYMSLVVISVSIGQLFSLVVGYFILDNFVDGDWRSMILITFIPGVIGFILAYFYLDDSPRYLLINGEYEKAFAIIDIMNKRNGCQKFQSLTQGEKDKLQKWAMILNKQYSSQDKASLGALFKGDLAIITPILWINMFSLSLIYYGIIILLPSLLDSINEMQGHKKTQEGEQDMIKLIISTGSELVAGFLASLMIELPGFGRKNSLINFWIILGITMFISYYDNINRFIFWVTLGKFYQVLMFTFSYQLIAEVYGTHIRTTGIGMGNSVGKFGGIMMPWISAKLQEINLLAPFLLFSLISFILSFVITLLPYDTLGREMDKLEESPEEKAQQLKEDEEEKLKKKICQKLMASQNKNRMRDSLKKQKPN